MKQRIRIEIEDFISLGKSSYGTVIEVEVNSFDEILDVVPMRDAIKYYEPENLLNEIDVKIIREYAMKYLGLAEAGIE